MRILVAESSDFSPEAARLLARNNDLTLADLDSAGLRKSVPGYDVIWVRLRSRVGREILDAATCLRAIATPTTGLTHIDLEEAQRRGISVVSLRGESQFLRSIRATAELTIALMLALLRKLPAAVDHTSHGQWDRDRFRGRELFGSTVGLVGFGRLGQLVARYLHAFDARVLAYDPDPDVEAVPAGVTFCPLSEVLKSSDIVSVHASLSAETEGLLGEVEIGLLRPGAILVNTARGELIDENALLCALTSKRLAGAALDVLAREHTVTAQHPLLVYARDHANLLVTPHIGGCTVTSMERTEVFLAQKLNAWLQEYVTKN